MTLVLGVDPGNSGAFAVYDTVSQRIVDVRDMPVWYQVVGKRKRPRIDALAVADYFDHYELLGVKLMVMEAVGGRPHQGASAAFVFGYGVGMIYTCGLYSQIAIDTATPAVWKKLMNVPGKGKADDTAILARATELFPYDREKFYTPRGGRRVDRAEAAMLAKYGGDFILASGVVADAEARLTYRDADTGA